MALKNLTRKGKPPHRKPSRNPQDVDKSTWFYDDKKGLLVVHEARTKSDAFIQTDQFVIPWRQVLAAARRCGKIE